MRKEILVLAAWTVILFALMVAPLGGTGGPEFLGFRHWDKLAHFGLFGITGIVSAYGAKFLGRLRVRLLFGLVFGLSLALITEGAQHFIAGRSGSFLDFTADVAGLSLALLLYALVHMR
jgi:VanZ family protein